MNTRIKLSQNWQFRQHGSSNWLPAIVPGTVHTDLLANEKIEDPFYRTNEVDLQWIDKVDWNYFSEFSLSESDLFKSFHDLVFEGLDTYAEVRLNGHKIFETDNMFCQWRTDCTPFLIPGKNQLQVYFHSPINRDLPKLAKLGYQPPAVSDESERGGLGDKKVSVFARKAPYHYGWDWGPRLVTSGIWRPVYLECWDRVRIRDMQIVQESLTDTRAKLTARFEIEADYEGEASLTLKTESGKWIKQSVQLIPGIQTIPLSFVINNPKRWWCNGLGDANLYAIVGQIRIGKSVLDQAETRIGLRTLRIVRNPDENGKSFYFELNGIPVFAKGANVIPQDNFVPRVTNGRYEHLVQSAARANMNMLRIWGGGIYETDYFYDLCDEHGILVWQDFMFACAHYPGDEAFLRNVQQEAVQNVKRLRNHPSIAIWCGNNEIDAAWSFGSEEGWGWKKRFSKELLDKLEADYIRLFKHLLPDVIKTHDPSRFYWPSSPQADWDENATYSTPSGDVHYWGVWHGQEPFENFEKHIGRFMSEYGFQSFPEMESLEKYTVPADWHIDSKVMQVHQRSGIGNRRIKSYMDMYYKNPKDFESLIYLGQVLQAKGIKTAIEAHRRRMPYCMGSLYWQLNDCWPVASWSSIDYYGRWKALHYAVKRAFEMILISPHLHNDTVIIDVVSDRQLDIAADLVCQIMDFDGQVLWEKTASILIRENTTTRLFESPLSSLVSGMDPECILLLTELRSEDRQLSENLLYFCEPKQLKLPPTRIHWKCERNGDGFLLIMRSDQLARNVSVSLKGSGTHFSDNFFDLLPGREKQITFDTEKSLDFVRKNIQIVTLWDSYSE